MGIQRAMCDKAGAEAFTVNTRVSLCLITLGRVLGVRLRGGPGFTISRKMELWLTVAGTYPLLIVLLLSSLISSTTGELGEHHGEANPSPILPVAVPSLSHSTVRTFGRWTMAAILLNASHRR